MGDHKIPKADPVDAAVAEVEALEEADRRQADADRRQAEIDAQRAEFPDHFRIDFKFATGEKTRLFVPNTLNSDQFETIVGLLMQARVLADQKRESEKVIAEIPKPQLVSLDGRRLT